VDGSTPNASSMIYTGAIPVMATTTIKALAVKEGMIDSTVVTSAYAIAATPNQGPISAADWTMVWHDEFSGTALDKSNWSYDIGNGWWDAGTSSWVAGWGNNELEFYRDDTADNVTVANGFLSIKAKKETPQYTDSSGYKWDYTSGKIKTKGLFEKKNGRFDIRAKLPVGKGLWPAIWMLPKSDTYGGWAASGELDIMEARGSAPKQVTGTIHYGGTAPDNKNSGANYVFPGASTVADFHTYSIEWEPGEIRWFVDGNLYQTQNRWYSESGDYPAPFDRPFYLIMNLAVGGNYDGNPDAATLFPQSMDVDYVRVYELTGKPYRTPVKPAAPTPEARPAGTRAVLADGNEVYNSGFNQTVAGVAGISGVANTSYWTFLTLPDYGGSASVALEPISGKNYAKFSIANGGTQPHSVQLIQEVPLVKGHYYKASFDAKASVPRAIQTKLSGGVARGFTPYSTMKSIKLSSSVANYDLLFFMDQESDQNARFEINMGQDINTVWIGNVRLEEVAKNGDWTMVWHDEFNNTSIDKSNWVFDTGNGWWDAGTSSWVAGWGNNELEFYRDDTADNVTVANGVLSIKAKKESPQYTDSSGYKWDYTSGKIKTKGLYAKQYGKVEVRAKLPVGKGLWPAIWMLPKSDTYGGWAASGELDIMEARGSAPKQVTGTIHYGATAPDNKNSGANYVFPGTSTVAEFHTYGIEWEPGEIRWLVDGNVYQTQNRWYSESGDYPAPFDRQFYLIMNLAVGGNYDGNPDAATLFPQSMDVDYVRVFELTGRAYKTPVKPAAPTPEARPAGTRAVLADGNEVYNSGFNQTVAGVAGISGVANTSYWTFLTLPDYGGSASVALEPISGKNYAKFSIANGGTQPHSVQLIQEVPLVKGHYYKASFDAKALAPRTIQTKLGGGVARGFTPYSTMKSIKLSSTVANYDLLFFMDQESDKNARFEINMGQDINTVWIGNVRLEEVVRSGDWTMVWHDEFSNASIDKSNWVFDTGNGWWDAGTNSWVAGWGNNELEFYRDDTADNVTVANGLLSIKAKKESPQYTDSSGYKWDYTSGKMKTKGLYAKQYGKVEVRAKLPVGKGLWPAIWMLPKSDIYGGWAASGELDIMEARGSAPNQVTGTIHYGGTAPDNKNSGTNYVFPNGSTVADFHTYSIEWEPGEIRWLVDGNVYQTQNRWDSVSGDYPAPFDRPFYLIMNLAVGGNYDGNPDAATLFPQTMDVDYVRVFELTGRAYRTPVEPASSAPEARPAGTRAVLADGNEIYNSGFNQTVAGAVSIPGLTGSSYWQFLTVATFGGSGNVTIDAINGRNYAKVNVTNGGNQPYSVQLAQDFPLIKGHYYIASFEAKSTIPRSMQVKIGGGEARGFKPYAATRLINMSAAIETYDIIFKMEDATDLATRLEFNVGQNINPVWIGNVKIREQQSGVLPN
ncbi:MAG: family 16 glycosylhydrolase, partial [Gorillibacterium sp.]|nr:family 16 glycosylhydrolase [Gorillibacterium sp.]